MTNVNEARLLNPIRDIIDPPKPKWRELVDEAAAAAANRHWLQVPQPTEDTC